MPPENGVEQSNNPQYFWTSDLPCAFRDAAALQQAGRPLLRDSSGHRFMAMVFLNALISTKLYGVDTQT